MILYRPVGLQELALIYDSGMKSFPARLPKQPIFYPVLQLEYARKTASGWNARNGQLAGYVTEFKVEDQYISHFETHTVGKSQHQELWIPTEEMEEFNKHIVGHIKVVEAHFGNKFEGFVPEQFGLRGKNAVEQFTMLANSFLYKRMEFYLEIKRNHKAVFLNYPFWLTYEFKNPELKEKILKAIKEAWLTSFPKIPLPLPPPTQEVSPPAKQPKAQRLVDPVQEEITVEEETNPDPWTDPLDEVTTLEEETDSWLDPVDDESRPIKQTPAHAFVKSVEEITPEEEIDEDAHWTDPVDEKIKPIEQAPVRAFVKSVEEEITPEEETDSDSFEELEDEEIVPLEPITPRVWVSPVREETTPEQQNPLMDPVDEEIKSIEESDSDAQHWTDHLDEESTSLAEDDFDSLDDLIEEESTPEAETDEDAHVPRLSDRVEEEITPREQTHPSVFVPPVRKEIKPLERTDSPVWAHPIHKESPPSEQTASRLMAGIKLGLSEKYREAVEELSKVIEEDPKNIVARTSLGVALHRLGEDNRAITSYEAALKIDPKNAEAQYFRANILYAHRYVREAITGYTMAIGLDPELIEAHQKPLSQERLTDYNDLPAGMYRIARPAQRILHLNKLLEKNPRQAKLFKERAAEYSRLWNYEQAIADYTSSLAIQPNDANVLHSRGVAYEQLGQQARAREDYQKAIAINPQLSHMYINRGIAFGRAGNFRQSIDSLTDAIRLTPKSPHGYFNRGSSYFQLGDLERAIADFSKAIQYSPHDEDAYYWRGIANEVAGHKQEAIADYKQFLAISQNPQVREEIERKLSQWNVVQRDGVNTREAVRENGQKTNQALSEKSHHDVDLHDLIVALGERALHSIWFGSGVECAGEKADELSMFTDHNKPIPGHDLLNITSGIRQTIAGDFTAFDPDTTSPWLLIRAWEGSGFYIEINDPKSKERLKTHFRSVEDVEETPPPYEGLFIHS